MSLEDPIVPQEYTHYASFTSLFILHMGIVCFENEEYVQGVISMLLYLTTLCHWYYVKRTGFILEADKMMVKSCFLYSIYSAYKYECRNVYYIGSLVNIMGFLINESLNKKTIHNLQFLQYATPQEKHRAYVRACTVHMFFLHFCQSELGVWVMQNCQKECRPFIEWK